MGTYDEAALLERARAILGDDEEILAAGIFGLSELLGAAMVGGVIAGTAADLVPGSNSPLARLVGTIFGQRLAVKDAAEWRGATVQLLVAVTPDTIHVLNSDTGGRLAPEFASFSRATTEVSVKKVGLSRHLTFTDGDRVLSLHGAGGGISPLARGDELVLDLLSRPLP